MEEKILLSKEEIDKFIKQVMVENDGWFKPESLWPIANPFAVMNRLDELGCWVHTYKQPFTPTFSCSSALIKQIDDNFYSGVQYNATNQDDNFIQDLFLSHYLQRQCYFSKQGEYNVCFVIVNKRTYKVFPGQYIIKKGITDFDIKIMNKEEIEKLEKVH